MQTFLVLKRAVIIINVRIFITHGNPRIIQLNCAVSPPVITRDTIGDDKNLH